MFDFLRRLASRFSHVNRTIQQVFSLGETQLSRRGFLQGSLQVSAVGAAAAASTSCSTSLFDSFFQKHYKELKGEAKAEVFAQIEQELGKKHGTEVDMSDPRPIPGTKFTYFLNLSQCNGNRKCVEACVRENNLGEGMAYIKVFEIPSGSLDFEKGTAYYDDEKVPQPGKMYLPVQCQQCDNPPCVKACPIEATWKEEDGIVVIDYDYCIGCRYCAAACPYEARHFNYSEPEIPKERFNSQISYLSNRPRPKGVMEKCTFCLHRTREGQNPACLEACPTGARKFGNILDKSSTVYKILQTKRVFVLKEELGTVPSFFYYFD